MLNENDTLKQQKERFYDQVMPSHPNEWEVDEIFDHLELLDEEQRGHLLDYVPAIWPVSHSLCFSYLHSGVDAIKVMPEMLLGDWVREILDLYEDQGLLGARRFMADQTGAFFNARAGLSLVTFAQVAPLMIHYLRGVSGGSLSLRTSSIPYTDTQTVYLPQEIDVFNEEEDNRLLYKFIVSLQWTHVTSGIFSRIVNLSSADSRSKELNPEDWLFGRYERPDLAKDVLAVLMFIQSFSVLKHRLPGLVRKVSPLCAMLIERIGDGSGDGSTGRFLRSLLGLAFVDEGACCQARPEHDSSENEELYQWIKGKDPLDCLTEVYNRAVLDKAGWDLCELRLLVGELQLEKAREEVLKRRREEKERFVALLSDALANGGVESDDLQQAEGLSEQIHDVILLMITGEERKNSQQKQCQIVLDNGTIDVSEELQSLSHSIYEDVGCLPLAYMQATSGIGGHGVLGGGSEVVAGSEKGELLDVSSAVLYDEWDYRRAGYRKQWCAVVEKSLQPVQSSFVGKTLEKYRTQLRRLRNQFEMLVTRERFVRRRRHGDEIDLDALIEALGDSRAGLSPTDRLFVRLLREERDICTMFLVDMSNSTEGWVGSAIKEALVLLAESLEVVEDRYAIYGFSGMRRSKSELYHVKHLHEQYSDEVRNRIAAITPMEYTRMGPPLRHLTQKLLAVESRVRLLLVISDGKPEDYDDYKGQYAIEDTKKALLEARGLGIHPFCITIDRSAHEYLEYMFGLGNYIFINNIANLPGRLTELYRKLTSG